MSPARGRGARGKGRGARGKKRGAKDSTDGGDECARAGVRDGSVSDPGDGNATGETDEAARPEAPSDEFRSALGDVKPLPPDKRRVPRSPGARPRPVSRSARSAGASTKPAAAALARFERPDPHEPRLAHVPGVSRRALDELRGGKPGPDRTIDLHGLDVVGAQRVVRNAVLAAAAAGDRCLHVIHGRGLRSAAGPVLKEALPGWLDEPGLRRKILAFAPAAGHDGGRGALAILLRRAR